MAMLKKYGLLWCLTAAALFFAGSTCLSANDVWYTERVAVIAYHHIDDRVKGDVTITTERLHDQLADLMDRGYHFITLQQFRDYLSGGEVPSNAVLVTFDDGYRSFYTNAYPILVQLNIPAVNFVITGNLDQPLQSRIPSLSREEIREMAGSGSPIDFQCHTDRLHDKSPDGQALLTARVNHGDAAESEPEYTKRITDDTNRCTAKLSELGEQPVDAFAFPFGVYDKQSGALLQAAGIRYAFTTVPGIADRSTDPMQIPRINAGSPFVKTNSLNNLIIRKLHRPQP